MIYQAKPQRGGRSIPVNTNNPPQDPPSPPVETVSPIEVESPVEIIKPITVAKPKVTKKAHIVPVIRLTIRQKISRFLKKIFRRI